MGKGCSREFLGGVPPSSPNPDPISDQKMSFSTPVFRPGSGCLNAIQRINYVLTFNTIQRKTNGCSNFRGLFTTKVIKSHLKVHVKSDAQKVNCPVHWIEIYPVESVNRLSNNWALISEIHTRFHTWRQLFERWLRGGGGGSTGVQLLKGRLALIQD